MPINGYFSAPGYLGNYFLNYAALVLGSPMSDLRPHESSLAAPVIAHNTTPEQWQKFLCSWKGFKINRRITDPFYLLICCDPALRNEVINSGNNIACKSEDEILATIKTLAVRRETMAQSRMKLFKMRQEPGDSTETFLTSLRRVANNCQFTINCECNREIDYSDLVVRDLLVQGLADSAIQNKVVSEGDLRTWNLEHLLGFIENELSKGHSKPDLPPEDLGFIIENKISPKGPIRGTKIIIRADF